MARQLQPCGTPAAYQRHRHRGEPIDDACRVAVNAYVTAYRKATGYRHNKARSRALTRLARRYHEAYRTLLAEEMAKEARDD